jgi:hypothetical protein
MSDTISKPPNLSFFGDNLFFGQRRFGQPLERERAEAFHVRRQSCTGDRSKSGKRDHFGQGCPAGLHVLCRNCMVGHGEIDQYRLA